MVTLMAKHKSGEAKFIQVILESIFGAVCSIKMCGFILMSDDLYYLVYIPNMIISNPCLAVKDVREEDVGYVSTQHVTLKPCSALVLTACWLQQVFDFDRVEESLQTHSAVFPSFLCFDHTTDGWLHCKKVSCSRVKLTEKSSTDV